MVGERGIAHAFWLRAPGCGEIRPVTLPEPGRDDVVVRTLRSGVSRGTETLVFRGGVPPGQYAAMRAPFQEGDFPGPVKYGYLNVGVVEQGPAELRGRTVFCLYPHQTAYVVPAGAVTVVPDDVPPARAVLAGTVETAVNALWDAAPLIGDRVAVVGAGMVGCCVARLLGRFPAVQVTLVDVDPGRAERRGARSASTSRSRPTPPTAATWSCTPARRPPGSSGRSSCSRRRARSSTSAGTATRRSGSRWAGPSTPAASASAPARSAPSPRPAAGAARRPTGWRSPSTCCATRPSTRSSPASRRFDELPDVMARLAAGSLPALCHTITYGEG